MSVRRRRSVLPLGVALVLLGGACAAADGDDGSATSGTGDASALGEAPPTTRPIRERYRYPAAPDAPAADVVVPDADAAIDGIITAIRGGAFDRDGVVSLAAAGDPRHAWFLADLLRFFGGDDGQVLVDAFVDLTGVSPDDDPDLDRSPWLSVTNHLIAWDLPAYPAYRLHKGDLFTLLEPAWSPFFDDADAEIDWRVLSWGGVFVDDRPLGDPNGCPGGCIPALDDPATTDAAGGDWYPDDRTVFGIVVDDEALAIPLNVAEVHEMFNLTLGGRRLGIPYCTLCGSAEAYLTDDLAGLEGPAVLRTSGLLSRSNKVMYELATSSAFDTFTGAAVSGSLQDAGVVLEEVTVVRSTWGEWKAEHPDTRIVAEDGGIGRTYDLDPLRGRDDDGPIFPIGEADARLDVQELVVGVITGDGSPVAFPSDAASAVLAAGGEVEVAGVRLAPAGDGLVAVDVTTGESLAAHEAFWFAWSQFHPDTTLWLP